MASVGAAALAATNEDEKPPFEIRACNGSAALCDRTLDEVVFPSTHNSMSGATEPSWLFANQNDGVSAQLEAGIRGLLIDTHYGIKTKKGVYTVLQPGGKSREKLAGPLGKEGLGALDRIRKNIGYRGGGQEGDLLVPCLLRAWRHSRGAPCSRRSANSLPLIRTRC